jgi:hypothetical protein
VVLEAARDYFASRRSRVDDFVARRFSLAGSLAIHRQALGWDVLKVPANILLAVPNVAMKLASLGARAAGAGALAKRLGSRQILLETAVGREIEWLIMTDLMELPYRQDGRESRNDALADAILSSARVEAAVREASAAVGGRADDPAFRSQLEETLATYTGTRAAAAEITTALMTAGAGIATVKQATPGALALGPALATAMAHQMAVASFPLGATLGGAWYTLFPVATSSALIVGLTGGILALGAAVAAFSGIIADPVQRRLGLHRRRLLKLIDTTERQFLGDDGAGLVVRDHYVARLLSLLELLAGAYGVARA